MRRLAARCPKDTEVEIYAHNRRHIPESLYRKCASSPIASEKDPSGKTVHSLAPIFIGLLFLQPLRLWQFPFLRRSGAFLFDKLFQFYRMAFLSRLEKIVSGADLVHCFSTGYLARCTREACMRKKIPLVQNPPVHFGRWGDSPGQLNAYRMSDAVICFTEHFRSELISRICGPLPRMEVIAPVVEKPEIVQLANPPLNVPYVLFIGRREKHKGLMELTSAFKALNRPVKLVVAGPGPAVLQENVLDLGDVSEEKKKWLLANCECLCVPSSDESFGIVYAEAMSYGKPVIALDIAPVNEIILSNVCGLLLPSANPELIREALETLLSDHELRKKMGSAARNRFDEKYSPEVNVSKILHLYNDLVKKSQ